MKEPETKTVEYYKEQTLKYIQMAEEAIAEGDFIDGFFLLELAKEFNSMALYLQSPTMLN